MKYLSHITTWTGSILIKQLNSLVLDKDEVVTVSEEDDLNEDENKSKVKSAKAITDLMLGLMDFKIGKFRWKHDEKNIIYHRVVDITYRYIKEKIIKGYNIIIFSYADKKTGKVEITDVIFDEPGGVSVQGSLKRRANLKKNVLPYK